MTVRPPVADAIFDAERDAPRAVTGALLERLERLVLFISLPGVLIFAAVEWSLGRGSHILAAYATLQLAFLVLWWPLRRSLPSHRALLLVGYGLVTAAISALHYGLAVGVAVAPVLTALWGGLVLGRRGAYAVAATTGLVLAGTLVLTHQGIIPPPSAASRDITAPGNWLRWSITMGAGAVASGWFVLHILRSLEASVDRARRALRRQEEERTMRVQAERALARAQRLDVLARLAGPAGVDIAAALQEILDAAEPLRDDDDPDVAELSDEIVLSARHALETAEELAAFDQAPSQGSAEAAAEVERTMRALQRTFPPGMDVLVDTGGPAFVPLSPASLDRVVRNLCINARDAMGETGRLAVTVEPAGSLVTLSVTDTGPGMPERELDRIFEPFFTTKGSLGTGLGLATVHRLVHSVGGTVDVRSVVGQGTCFTIELPRASGGAQSRPPRELRRS